MKLIRTEDAVGHVLCHDLTQIIRGSYKDARFRKGHIVTEEDIPVLLSMGKEHLYVWEMEEGMLHENEAAERLYDTYAPRVVVITQGKRGGILYDGERLRSYPVYPATVLDSNGSGDVFHGAFAAGVTRGFDFEKCCHFASAVSALKCMGVGARESVPDLNTVKRYMKENGYEL